MTAIPPPSPWPGDTRFLQAGDLVVNLAHRRLRGEGVEPEVPQRVFDLLLLFLAEPDVLHSRDELFERLWPGVIVEDANLSQSIWLLRRALGEPRKHWVRTVAKGGYVFEPPSPVRILDAAEAAAQPAARDAGGAATTPSGKPLPATTDAATPRGPRRTAWLAVTILLLGVALAAAWWWWPGEHEALPAPPPRQVAIALIDVDETGSGGRWPVVLLHEWLQWKLDDLPEVTLLSEADLATRTDPTPPVVVFLSTSPVAGNPERLRLQARFEEGGRVQRLETDGSRNDVPAMAQTLSDQLLRRLVPTRHVAWPPLELDARAAERYAEGVDAYRRRDWMRAATILREVAELAPRFGLVRLQLAQTLSHLSDLDGAREQIGVARELLRPAPAEVAATLEARTLAARPEQAVEAAAAFARLARQYPAKPEYLLRQSALELAANRPQQALATAQARDWSQDPLETRLHYQRQLAGIHRALGDSKSARAHATAAAAQAEAAGDGWELEHALALVEDGRAAVMQDEREAAVADFERAATLFDSAGNRTGRLYAQFMAAISGGRSDFDMDALLARARAGGNRRLEIEILLREAARHHALGDLDAYRRRMREALASAEAAGDRLRRDQLELLLLNEDMLAADFASAARRLSRLREAGLKGTTGVLLVQLEAALRAFGGDLAGALRVVDDAERRVAPDPATPGATALLARLACFRAPLELELGRLPDARAAWNTCASGAHGEARTEVLLGRAETELLAGDAGQSRILRDRAAAAIATEPDGPDRWSRLLTLADLHLLSGEHALAARAARDLQTRLRGTGYHWYEARSALILAEAAAQRGEWGTARRYARQVRTLLPDATWLLRWRADLIEALSASAAGDRDDAGKIVARLHRDATAHDDVLALLLLHARLPGALPPDCTQVHRDALVARSGLRGALRNPYPSTDATDVVEAGRAEAALR